MVVVHDNSSRVISSKASLLRTTIEMQEVNRARAIFNESPHCSIPDRALNGNDNCRVDFVHFDGDSSRDCASRHSSDKRGDGQQELNGWWIA